MAVDRSKFRTCEQTSFCRRHRHAAHGSLFRYKLVEESIQFHTSNPATDNIAEQEAAVTDAEAPSEAEAAAADGVWQSIQRRLLGNTKSGEGVMKHQNSTEPSLRGPAPTLTGRLHNVASSPLSSNDSHSKNADCLTWSVTALSHGLLRMRVTECYGRPGTATEQPRVTYDDLVLNVPAMHPAGHALWIRPLHDTANEGNKQQQPGQEILSKLLQQRGVPVSDYPKYTALQYGDDSTDHDNNNQKSEEPESSRMILLIQMEPFSVALYREAELTAGPIVELGTEQMMHFEVRRFRDTDKTASSSDKNDDDDDKQNKETVVEEGKEIVGYWEDGLAIYADGTREEKKETLATENEQQHRQLTEAELDQEGLWEESFGSHTDTKPYGPMSVGLDVKFPQSTHLYGIPEHASSSVLQATTGTDAHYKEPYRLYNLDVFEYELDETMALYGQVPLIVSQSVTMGSVGVFWFNPTETFVDVTDKGDGSRTHWISESGIMDLFLLPGPDPSTLYKQYSILTGSTPLPPMFSLGYHQCRWNYKDEKDVAMVHGKFEELDFPYDVLWLDIEHTDGKRYFTWDKNLFPNPKQMQQNLIAQGRRMVTIVDPHIFRDDNYYIHKDATAKGLYIKDKDGKKDFDGWCWPGSSSYLDFTAEHVRNWWAEQFGYNKYVGSTPSLFTWNDMNEPSVFNGPEVSMQKDLRNLNGEEHREWHNLYGMLFHRATGEGQIARNKPNHDVRPFVLSRAFFAGSQKYGAIWTGDNTAEWGHLQIAAPMLLSLNSAALSFVGADVGGFFGNPDAELITRWMQAAAYQPFFRGHAHHDSKRREPWMFDDATLVRMRRAAMTRYALLPYWYTIFYQAETTGMPVMRMMWMQYPNTFDVFALDDQYMIGSDLLVKPVTSEGATEVDVVFPTEHLWYNVETMVPASSSITPNAVVTQVVPADLDTIPVYQRGGSIISRKLRLRRSTMLMKTDPYTLYIALDNEKRSTGTLHMDDEETFGYRKRSEFADASFLADFSSVGRITNSVVVGSGWVNSSVISDGRMIERIIVMGLYEPPTKVSIQEGEESIAFTYIAETGVLVIRKPELSAMKNWSINFS